MPNPVQPDLPGDPTPLPGPWAPGQTKEVATTRPTHPKRPEETGPPGGRLQQFRRLAGSHQPTVQDLTTKLRGLTHGRPRPRHLARTFLARAPKRWPRGAARQLGAVALIAAALLLVAAPPAFAAGGPSLNGVISSLTTWIVGILAGVATLFLTIGGLRYLAAGGDPGQVEKAKTALKSAAIGYALAILAPLLVSIIASVVGG